MEAEKYLVRTRALRSQRDGWKQAAVGILALSITGNIGLYTVGLVREARHQEEAKQLRAELRHVEAVRDDALEELGRMANDYALEAKARREQAEGYEALGSYQYIGGRRDRLRPPGGARDRCRGPGRDPAGKYGRHRRAEVPRRRHRERRGGPAYRHLPRLPRGDRCARGPDGRSVGDTP